MKNIVYVFLSVVLMACSGQKEITSSSEPIDKNATQWLTFDGKNKKSKHIVFITGDEEYRSEEAMAQMAKILSKRHGFKATVLFAQEPDKPGIINANYSYNIPGLEALTNADMMVIFTRFRALPDEQMRYIDNYLKQGKPVMGIRTATHAFNFDKDSDSKFIHYSNGYQGEKTAWKDGFGRLVLGEKWISHHGSHKHQSTRGIIAPTAMNNAITNGISDGDVWGPTDVYGVRLPLLGDSQPILLGQVVNRKGEFDPADIFYGMKPTDSDLPKTNDQGVDVNSPMMPIAWTKSYQLPEGKKGKVFTSTIGAANDLLIEGTRRLLVNGVYWALDLPVPAKANVTLVGDYQPTTYEFRNEAYWHNKQLKVEDFK